MKNSIKKRIKGAMEGILFEPVSMKTFEGLHKKITRILREEDYEYDYVMIRTTIEPATGNTHPMPSVEIHHLYGPKIVVSLELEGHNERK